MSPRNNIIVSLDFDSASEALELVERLGPLAGSYKVGLQLLTAAGPTVVRKLIVDGKEVFLDLKLHEIPTSVSGAVSAAGALGVSMVTVHASGGSAVLRAAVEAARPYPNLKVLALTVITSLRDEDLTELGLDATVPEQVIRLAKLAAAAGCHGVVASAQEAWLLRSLLPAEMLIVTPGTQLRTDAKNDQARVATPFDAIRWGASHVVIGRSISRSANPSETLAVIQAQVDEAVSS
ncbi:orotidine-5'-phosphate decarboxylase [Variovorax sp. EL159]|uniref:orotidine-5'-phosphate decarboxylase n=1 Tax=Variovorax sp. EL159 TaxID=1566270 RepID=UPI00087FF5D9|nr:orotidine-5'-phosphate decarboxylase [Variovorax sp. EL159]SCX66592.1 orotidine-5'-phosphate decarboxylase [Variovorax sp. EL159]